MTQDEFDRLWWEASGVILPLAQAQEALVRLQEGPHPGCAEWYDQMQDDLEDLIHEAAAEWFGERLPSSPVRSGSAMAGAWYIRYKEYYVEASDAPTPAPMPEREGTQLERGDDTGGMHRSRIEEAPNYTAQTQACNVGGNDTLILAGYVRRVLSSPTVRVCSVGTSTEVAVDLQGLLAPAIESISFLPSSEGRSNTTFRFTPDVRE